MIGDFGIVVAFVAGLVSFLSPCVLPIIPGFLAYLAGAGSNEQGPSRGTVFLHSVLFVLGFSSVFALLGVLLNTVLQSIAYDVQTWLARIGGVIIIFFGLYLMKLIRVPFLERAHTINVVGKVQSKHVTSFLFGAAFAAGWTPCVGAALGAILGLAASAPGTALTLLFAYAVGLGVPFLIIGAFAAEASTWLNKATTSLGYVQVVFGVLLVVLGILIFTQNLSRLANFEILNRILIGS